MILPLKNQLTYRNHFKFGYNNSWFNKRSSPNDIWNVKYGPCEKKNVEKFDQECVRAAHIIYSSTDRIPWLLLSGGIDSEIMALSFIKANVPFIGVSLKFSDDLNAHDLYYVKKFIKKYSIKHEMIEFNILDFFESDEFNYLAHQTKCVSPQLPTLMSLMSIVYKKGGYPVVGSGECYFKRENDTWFLYEREKIASLYRFLMINGISGCAGFFQFTPEQIKAFYEDSIMQKLFSGDIPHKPSNYSLKYEIYSNYFNIEERPKYTGYEKISKWDNIHRNKLKSLFPEYDSIAKTSCQNLVSSLTQNF